ncbi:PAS domain-containing protein [Stakelama saccharophila]|uniref:PAS domain-containing protein n=1 Tax=Stakelama saccharophila TaxID=3075605 RepID=A0ABZ0BAM8_9SPHN|nr:hypothetical protein [Stakelama sp. W311]WNO54471.1 hypothetical protein RPR59_04235 [Stakelama sp. W311]
MDSARGIDDRIEQEQDHDTDDGVVDTTVSVGTDERRMHVRAYNYWVSLLNGRPFPSIEDLQPDNIADFGPNSVLLDFSEGVENPAIRYLGSALREECGVDSSIRHVAEVPSRSLLSRLTDHYLQIIANRAPIGFEAEFVGQRGHNTLYRGILMPFSAGDDSIDFIYGVINWKEMVDAETQAGLDAEIAESRRAAPVATSAPTAPVWADGPGVAEAESETGAPAPPLGSPLADQLMLARETAAQVRAADTRSRAALYRALGRAHDFALACADAPDAYADLLKGAGLKAQDRAPLTPIVKLVFGVEYDKARVTEFAAALAHARRHAVPVGAFPRFIEDAEGGLKGLVKAERAARRPAPKPDRYAAAANELRRRPALAQLPIGGGADDAEFVVLVARKSGAAGLDVVARVDGDAKFTAQAVRRALD